jgi:hypothetical protein
VPRQHADIAAVPAVAGFLLGPSVGSWYVGRAVNPAMITRGAALVVGAGVLPFAASCIQDEHTPDHCGLILLGFAGAVVTYGVASFYEMGAAAEWAKAHNRRHGWDVQVTPAALPGPGGTVPGLGLSGRF